MTRWLLRYNMPMLRKELAEQAARKRTYLARLVFCVPLYLLAASFVYSIGDRSSSSSVIQGLGSGGELFWSIVTYLFVAIYLFQPVLMCGAIAAEKERDSLVLLMVTDLRPFEIVLQKFVGRLVPMFSVLMLSLPALAVAYSYGGVSTIEIVASVVALMVTCLQVAALTLMFSAWCRSAAGALIGTYLFGSMIVFAPVIVYAIVDEMILRNYYGGPSDNWAFIFLPFVILYDNQYELADIAAMGEWDAAIMLALWAIAPLLLAMVALLLARWFLVRRAMLPARNLLLAVFRKLDRGYKKMNDELGGITLSSHTDTLPDDQPIAWWELTKRTMGQPQHLFRLAVLLYTPVVFMGAFLIFFGVVRGGGAGDGYGVAIGIYWVIAILLILITSVNTFANDRRRQILRPLLAAPLDGRDIVAQKQAAVRRLQLLCGVPILTIVGFEAWVERGMLKWTHFGMFDTVCYILYSAALVVVLFKLVSWFAMWLGLKMRKGGYALVTALAVTVAWLIGVPLLLEVALEILDDINLMPHNGTIASFLTMLVSPMQVLAHIEFLFTEYQTVDFNFFTDGPAGTVVPQFAIVLCLGLHAGLFAFFRSRCLKHADAYLGRV